MAGRRIAPAPAVLDVCLRAAAAHVDPGTPLVLGGRSAGARSAARCARELGAAAYLALAFPLHPPGRPERSRLEELEAVRLPTLIVQGERDALGRPEEFPEPLPAGCELAVVPGADHAFAVRKRDRVTAEETMAFLVRRTLGWLARTVPGNRT